MISRRTVKALELLVSKEARLVNAERNTNWQNVLKTLKWPAYLRVLNQIWSISIVSFDASS